MSNSIYGVFGWLDKGGKKKHVS